MHLSSPPYGHVTCREERRGTYRILVGKPEGKTPLVIPRSRWTDHIKIAVQEIGIICGLD